MEYTVQHCSWNTLPLFKLMGRQKPQVVNTKWTTHPIDQNGRGWLKGGGGGLGTELQALGSGAGLGFGVGRPPDFEPTSTR